MKKHSQTASLARSVHPFEDQVESQLSNRSYTEAGIIWTVAWHTLCDRSTTHRMSRSLDTGREDRLIAEQNFRIWPGLRLIGNIRGC